ncbi:acyltransferase domain-containing protein [Pseudenhygromyxa sp. WMMC2535]|uniref:type I polyketide synthase n=1 Tax=Pseudenhygromyxa sp. WMMC2535 TaxID=2712867 RepID=UPI00155400A5|nr:type I polyketide synthase [Pseudenhygromyxa sp. WMMC2535]NVB36871.1 acyltransferase domain-containing protein [Pseudenhygromyxa sp. WMMC2535]
MDKSELLRQSLARIQALKARVAELEAPPEPIAIVGMGLRFPGGLDDPRSFWAGLRAGVDVIREIPESRWPEGRAEARFAGMLDRVYTFEPGFFGISEREARMMDPQQRLMLEVAWSALADAGLPLDVVRGSRAGVFVGASGFDWALLAFAEAKIDAYAATGSSHAILANRLSYLWDLRGPSLSVDAACASSLVALHLAVAALRRGECDLALAGGVQHHLVPHTTLSLARFGMMAADGRCKAFDHRGDGFVRSEGCGVVALRRLADVDPARDRIYALIHGTAINQDGRSNGLTAPSALAQARVLRAALADARVEPARVGLIETHGTGTALGDPIEFQALAEVYGGAAESRGGVDAGLCALGAVKTNLGHTEAAAGVAGLIKTALAIHHREIPGNLHLERVNPDVDIEGTRFYLPREAAPWSGPGLAAVSSFGFGGTNAHAILGPAPGHFGQGEHQRAGVDASAGSSRALVERPRPLLISAATREAFFARVEQLRERVEAPASALDDLAYTLAERSAHLPWRGYAVGDDRQALVRALSLAHPVEAGRAPARVVFLCSGQGGQWLDMGRSLARWSAAFRDALARCEQAIDAVAGWSLSAALADADELARVDRVQPAIFAMQVSLAALWRSAGVEPDVVLGTSMGEVAAAQIAGLLGLEDAARVITTRSRLIAERLDRPGAMASVALSEAALRERLAGHDGDLEIAVVNSPDNVVVAGSPGPLAALMAALEGEGVFTRRIQVDYASHCAHVEVLAEALEDALTGLRPGDGPRVPMLSTVTLEWLEDATAPRYWQANLRESVRLWPALSEVLRPGEDLFVELSPHPVLAVPLEEPLAAISPAATLTCGMARGGGPAAFIEAMARSWARGAAPSWAGLWPAADEGAPGRVTSLPRYPWAGRRYAPTAALEDPRAGGSSPESASGAGSREDRDEASAVDGAGSSAASGLGLGLEQLVLETLAVELGTPAQALRMDVPLRELGLDSLMASHLRGRVKDRGVELGLLDVLQAESIAALLALVRERQARGAVASAPAGAAGRARPLDAWFVRPRPKAAAETETETEAEVVLYCVPYGGGAAGAFRPWAEHMPAWLELRAVEPPGRGTRLGEAWPESFDALVDALVEALLADLVEFAASGRRFALYGHCSGSLVAFEVARRLVAAGKVPAHLFVAALGPPSRYRLDELVATVEGSGAALHDMSDELMMGFLRGVEFQGLAELERDPQLRDLAMATMRGDSQLMMSFRPSEGEPLPVAITALGGGRDPSLTIHDLWSWATLSAVDFDWWWFPEGNHYFHADKGAALAEIFAILREGASHSRPLDTGALTPVDIVRAFHASWPENAAASATRSGTASFMADDAWWRITDLEGRVHEARGLPWFAAPISSVLASPPPGLDLEVQRGEQSEVSTVDLVAPIVSRDASGAPRRLWHRAHYRVAQGRIIGGEIELLRRGDVDEG